MERQPHVLVVSFPAQGHISPLMKLSIQIAAHGVKVTFFTTEVELGKFRESLPENFEEQSSITLVSIPDGVDEDVRYDPLKTLEAIEMIRRVIPNYVAGLIAEINQSGADEKISCVIADISVGGALEVAKKMGLEAVAIWPAAAPCLALAAHVPILLQDEIINSDGIIMKDEPIMLSKDVPACAWSSSDIGWRSSHPILSKALLGFYSIVPQYAEFYDLILCNSVYELDSPLFKLIPKALPIGPLLFTNRSATFAGKSWPKDSPCSAWLNEQPAGSVIYVALGSSTIASAKQVEELALGLEISGQPFLWIVRPDFMDGSTAKFPDGFRDRVSERSRIVEWAPQEMVLSHPSVSCFVSHCGWNSTMEGLTMGVPFLCWPYIADQFSNKKYICDVLKTGLELNKDENGITSRYEISSKINTLISSDVIRETALHAKDIVRKSSSEGGSSLKNFKSFIDDIKSL
ncbi:UDP-glycosyltransferase 83A1 [Hibiscus syriacus]|uniref:UDP-glycosyltransferase 83A1 n=1 Tax=Hibiscus syriacus TaxID=106335 RepID=A0A6A3BH79_HIBSY|nr:UDP-glycosyltransferase 83A1-like [Hibiscus syriacus]KAE8716023.1 UDP-glycosyltransferase 83A1 [Hibiscus syriacus]